jgi:hypothetical protein
MTALHGCADSGLSARVHAVYPLGDAAAVLRNIATREMMEKATPQGVNDCAGGLHLRHGRACPGHPDEGHEMLPS